MKPATFRNIERHIYFIREQRIMLDSDLAKLYGVTTFNLNKAIKRNRRRFPIDFMFRLSPQESEFLIFQSGISSSAWGGRRHRPYAFTHEGISMLSSVLRSEKALRANIFIMRAFVKVRQLLIMDKELARKIALLESKVQAHDVDIRLIVADIRKLMNRLGPGGTI